MIFSFSRNNFSDSKLQIYLRVYIRIESPKGFLFSFFRCFVDDDDDDDDDALLLLLLLMMMMMMMNE